MNLIISENNPSICLNMIVKDESHIIRDTLQKLCNKIKFDYWVICDTGSTDNTPQIILDFFNEKNIKGELHHDKWVNFAHNRTLALERAYRKTQLLLVFDADDEIIGNIEMPHQVLYDEYHMKFGSPAGTMYTRVLLINNYKRFEYLSVIHEFISCKEPGAKSTTIEGDYFVVSGRSGNRSKDPEKYLKDALILEKAYNEALQKNDPLFHRYSYYCANSYKDCGKFEEAIKWYIVTLSHEKQWAQEKYTSCLYIYDCYKALNKQELGFFYLVKAFAYDTERVECLFPLLVHYCCDNMHKVAYNYYLNVKDYMENKYLNDNILNKLFVIQDKFSFFVPYYMILIADKVQDFKCVIRMYEIVFHKKQFPIDEWYIKNLLYNLQFFLQHVPSDNTSFIPLANEYIKFLQERGVALHKFDFFLKDEYRNAGINLEYIFVQEVTNKDNKFSEEECKNSKNILIYTGFSEIKWNYSYMATNALGGSEKAVAYLSTCFPKDYHIYIGGQVAEEHFDNISYVPFDDNKIKDLVNSTPFHTVIVSRYIAFYEMFQECSFYQSFIWAHDVLLLPYGCYFKEDQIVTKWNKYISGCICLTEWHRDLFLERYPQLTNKIHLINNGIDLSQFKPVTKKIPNKFIYSSRPDRGLNILLELWPQILAALPDATLVISSYGNFPSRPEDQDLLNIINKYNSIRYRGQLNTADLYEEISTSEFWLYPTHWPETSCITALEMLMSEVICLYYPVAGLTNTMDKYGIQIEKGNEIDKLISLSPTDKSNLRKNGKIYVQTCSWNNRSLLWCDILTIKSSKPVIPCKNIAIFNSFQFHYELYGYIIEYCKKYNHKLTIFTSFDYQIGWLDFYKKHFNNYQFEYKSIYDYPTLQNSFDITFVTTDDDYAFKPEWINDKCISINHSCMVRRPEFKHKLATRSFCINSIDWALPCFTTFSIEEKMNELNNNVNDNVINIALIGGTTIYNENLINRLQSDLPINLFVIGRHVYMLKAENIKKDINVVIRQNIDTDEMYKIVKSSDYILTDATFNDHHTLGISMSGNIPLAFSTLTPLIMNKHNNSIYKFKNVIEFDHAVSDNIVLQKNQIDLTLLNDEREKLINMFHEYANNFILTNCTSTIPDVLTITNTNNNNNTALIVDPRDDDTIAYLINDFKHKLGDNWTIVFYCGKGLTNKMKQLVNTSVEIRELDVNNFTITEYSDFMKNRTLWESLYGEYVLTFQLDTYILNEEPYTVDYFIQMNKSYIGGNMDHGWFELARENLFIQNRNFNGGLSLRKRLDMINIINTFGTEKTVDNYNSIHMKTDAEDVYFTIGCYKLNLPIGDNEECSHFCVNRIWTDGFFGLHKPRAEILQNSPDLSKLYCHHTNRFIVNSCSDGLKRSDGLKQSDRPKQKILFILPNWYNPAPLEDYVASLRSIYQVDVITEDHHDDAIKFIVDMVIFICIVSSEKIYNHFKDNTSVGVLNTEPLNIGFRLSNFKEHIPKDADKHMRLYDYSLSNLKILNGEGYMNTAHLPYLIYEPENTFLSDLWKNTKKEYDFGIVSYENPIVLEKRRKVVDFLLEHNYTVNIIHGWREHRDKELAKCSIILNIHGQCGDYNSEIFEHIRCDRLLAAGFNILSESSLYLDEQFINTYPNLKIIAFNDFFDLTVYNQLYSDLFKERSNVKIVDCFTFYNEINMLTYRLNALNEYVDYFVLVEANQTHVGNPKPLFFDENKTLFEPFLNKIIHIVVDLPYGTNINIQNGEQWQNEIFQRNSISQGIDKISNQLTDRDFLIIADVDEIPDPTILLNIKNKTIVNGVNVLEQDFYYYNLLSKRAENWTHCKAINYKTYKEMNVTCNDLRFMNGNFIQKGGWHLSYFGDANFIKNKLENFAHQEYNSDEYTDVSKIQDKINNNLDLFNRGTNNVNQIPIEDNNYLPPLYDKYLTAFYPPIKKNIYCVIHICNLPTTGTAILDFIIDVIIKTGFIDYVNTVYINNIGLPIDNKYRNDKIIVTNYSQNPLLFEYPGLNKAKELASNDPNSYILYLHTKGVVHNGINNNVRDWTNMMLYFLVEKYEDCIKQLDNGYDTVGCEYKPTNVQYPKHYSGNFWWSKAKYLNTLNPLDECNINRSFAEFWLLTGDARTYDIYSTDVNHYYDPYPMDKYSSNSIIYQILHNKKIIGFHSNQLGIRGTEVALYDYAHYMEDFYNYKSIIFYYKNNPNNNTDIIKKFEARFKCYAYQQFSDIEEIILKEGISNFYTIKSGAKDDCLVKSCPNLVHAVFTVDPHGEKYATISKYLSDKYDHPVNYVPHMINLPSSHGNRRDELNIPADAFVIGRYGGFYQFDNSKAHNAIIHFLENKYNENLYFLFANTYKFYEHKQIIYLDGIVDPLEKVKFINTCDAMIHARSDGETFGLAIGEFSSLNKPIITCKSNNDNAHLEILGDKAIIYDTEETLINILQNIMEIKNSRNDWNAYQEFNPVSVMSKFKSVFLPEEKLLGEIIDYSKINYIDMNVEPMYLNNNQEKNIVIVSAYFDIGRSKWNSVYNRSNEDYIEPFFNYFNCTNKMIVFVDDRYIEKIKQKYKETNRNHITFIPINIDWMKQYIYAWTWNLEKNKQIMKTKYYTKLVSNRISNGHPENIYADYNVINHSKIDFICYAINNKLICENDFVCWSDFGVFFNKPKPEPFTLDIHNFNTNSLCFCLRNTLDKFDEDIIYTLTNAPEKFTGTFFGGPVHLMTKLQNLFHLSLEELLINNISDDDQHVLLRTFLKKPSMFTLYLDNQKWPNALQYFKQKDLTDIKYLIKSFLDNKRYEYKTELCEIMNKYGSDKGNGWHNYTSLYYHLFKEKRHEKLHIFELGLGSNNINIPSNMGMYGKPGASLYGFNEFFKNSKIFGADIDPDISIHTKDIHTYYCDQLSCQCINNMFNNPDLINTDFDLIIEDGLHTFDANMRFMTNSLHKLKPNGIYIIEDIDNYCKSQFTKDLLSSLAIQYNLKYIQIIELPNANNTHDNNLLITQKNDQYVPLFCITSLINLTHGTVFSPEERYVQTIKTIESIYSKVPNARIVILEASDYKYDIQINNKFNNLHIYYIQTDIQTMHKSVGEATILQEFCSSDFYKQLLNINNINIVFKISGRYWLDDNFELTKFNLYKHNFMFSNTFTDKNNYKNNDKNDTDLDMCGISSLFSFNPNYSKDFLDCLSYIITSIITTNSNNDIEHILYEYYHDKNNYNLLDPIGISGYIAPTGQFVSY